MARNDLCLFLKSVTGLTMLRDEVGLKRFRRVGFETGYEIDGFLKARNVYEDFTMEDFERERETLKSLGF
jgi:hypothetical protein